MSMIQLSSGQTPALRDWFLLERPGPLVGPHVVNTGNGGIYVDRWPDPRAVLAKTAGNLSLPGEPGAMTPEDLHPRIRGFVDAPEAFAPLLRAASPDLRYVHQDAF